MLSRILGNIGVLSLLALMLVLLAMIIVDIHINQRTEKRRKERFQSWAEDTK